jgi:hypothetical protein
MSTGQTLNRLEAVLDKLHDQIRQEGLELTGSGATLRPDDMKFHDFWSRIKGYGDQLHNIVKYHLSSIDSSLVLRSQRAWGLPRHTASGPSKKGGSPRYAERQAIASHRKQLERIYAQAAKIERALRDLEFHGQAPTYQDLVVGVNDLFKDLDKMLGQTETADIARTLKHGTEFEGPDSSGPSGTPLSFIVTLIACYILSRNKNS